MTQKGKKNHAYIDGRTLKKYYCSCGKEMSYDSIRKGAKRCHLCYYKTLKGSGNPQFDKKRPDLSKWNKKHPRLGKNNPMYGKKRPDLVERNKLRRKHPIKYCLDCKKQIPTEYTRCQKCWYKFAVGKNATMFGKLATHGIGGKYRGIYMRSSWEIAYAKYLDRNNIEWDYEPKTFDLGNTTYTPDFYLPESNTYVEIKGYWRDDAKRKFKMFQKKCYSMNIVLLMKKDLQLMEII